MKPNKLSHAVKGALAFTVLSSGFVSQAALAEDEAKVERIEVTGSRIQRAEFESASPIASFDASDIANSGVTSVDEFLKFIPATSGFQLGATTNNGNDGAKKIDLRGLDFNRTLVLINGKRSIGDVNDDGAVDLNQVPLSMVKRIDVLKDGASTIYGTDAIAGVINIVLYNDFEGVRVGASYGAGTEDWDAEQKTLSIMMGTASDKGSITVGIEYNSQKELKQGDRDWAHDALWPDPIKDADGNITGFKPVASGSSNSRTIRLTDEQIAEVVAKGGPKEANWIVDSATGEVRPFKAATDAYNYAPVNALITPNDRFQIALNGRYQVSDTMNAYVDAFYTQRESLQRLAPDASFGTGDGQWLWDNSNNPFGDASRNPYGVDFSAGSLEEAQTDPLKGIHINRRFTESGGRIFTQKANTYRILAGIDGEITDSLFFDVSFTHGYNEQLDNTKFYHRFDRWQTAVNEELCLADNDCAAAGVLNPFADFGTITPEQMTYLSASSLKDFSFGELRHFIATLSGEVEVDFGGGYVGWAAGFENRKEKGEFIPDEFSAAGLTTGGASDPQKGHFQVDEFYVETYLPLHEKLSIEAAVRYSDYENNKGQEFDSTNFKISLDWRPLDGLKVRGGYSTGFRAPNITEMNQSDSTDFPTVDFICSFADLRTDLTANQRTNCETDGFTGKLGFAWQPQYTTKAPEKLDPEESVTTTLGFVYTVPMEDNLVFSVDYWSIEIEDLIGETPYQFLFNSCMDSANYSASTCSAFKDGKPLAGQLPANATYSFGNVGELDVSGIDFELDYSTDLSVDFANKFGVRLSGTYNIERLEKWVELGFELDRVGKAYPFEVYPELKFTTSFRLSADDWDVNYDLRYIDETIDGLRPAETTDDNIADSVLYHDISFSYNLKAARFSLGVSNLLDEEAPRYHSGFNANTAPGTYDTIGRRLFASFSVDF
ncbi:TonB-dependent receptor plug domain-containing protein [Pseudoalteromonas sp. T1lg65]|uniref:TonB-dependent receptor plug domain-containing protein n=1 Tax=Pseudoalteromonas sp. T1lg65 TaxID=2077101 RepID=UPI003F79EF6A